MWRSRRTTPGRRASRARGRSSRAPPRTRGTRAPAARCRSPCRAGRSRRRRRRRSSAGDMPGRRSRDSRARVRAARGTAAACDPSSTSPPCRSGRSSRGPGRLRRPPPGCRGRGRGRLQAERRQLDGDVRVEAFAVDPCEDVEVLAGDRARLVGAGHLLAEDVDRRELPAAVQLAHHAHGIVEGRAGDVSGGEPLDDRSWHSRQQPDERTIQCRSAKERHGRRRS